MSQAALSLYTVFSPGSIYRLLLFYFAVISLEYPVKIVMKKCQNSTIVFQTFSIVKRYLAEPPTLPLVYPSPCRPELCFRVASPAAPGASHLLRPLHPHHQPAALRRHAPPDTQHARAHLGKVAQVVVGDAVRKGPFTTRVRCFSCS